MGIISNIRDVEGVRDLHPHYQVITTMKRDTLVDYFKDYEYISLGELLSSVLLKYEKKDRKNHVLKELDEIFRNLDSKKVIVDSIDILFNPEYNIDILGFFTQLGRNRRLIVLWPGEYYSESLTYAAPGYKDYKKYSIKDYDIICLK